jgi:CRISPR type III-B/RAMP module RAMP protein Cmr1
MVATTIPRELLDEADRAAEERVRGLTVLDAEFVRVTAWWGGGPHGETLDVPTSSSIVGRVRWFIRTVYNRFCAQDLSNYEESMAFVDGFLGSIAGASRYRFSVQPVGSGDIAGRDPGRGARNGLGDVPRVKLHNLSRGRRDERWEPRLNVAPFRLTISRNPGIDGRHDDLVAGATLLTMAYVGVGKAASRGFGRFYPMRIHGDGVAPRIARAIRDGEPEEAFGSFYGLGRNLCGSGGPRSTPNRWRDSRVPLAPRVGCDEEDCVFAVRRGDAERWDEVEALGVVGNCFMKSTWKRSRGSLSNCGHLGAPVTGGRIPDYMWIFGLPRSARAPNDRSVSTGYFLDGDPGRRVSTVIASPFRSLNDGDQRRFRGILLLPFLSLDDHLRRAGKLRILGVKGGKINSRQLFSGGVDAGRLGDGIAEAVRALRCICEKARAGAAARPAHRGGGRGELTAPRPGNIHR